MKGIILAGGKGTRLYPITQAISKQLMPIYDKPMIYYPLSLLLQSGIREILIITNPEDTQSFQHLLGDGRHLGCSFQYAVQPRPDGLAQAFLIGEEFIGSDSVCLVLGDNIFYGGNLDELLESSTNPDGGIVFSYRVNDPERYGVVEFDSNKKAISIDEKPDKPKSNYAISGIYFYDNSVVEYAKTITPSSRGELEITDINKLYLAQNNLSVHLLEQGTAWLDTGTFESMNDASEYVRIIEKRQGTKIGCIEEIAYRKGFITKMQLETLATPLLKSGYGDYLLGVVKG